MEKRINNVLTLMDDKSYLRNQLFKLFAIDSIEGIKFYYSMGEKSKIPFFGKFFKKLMESYYKNVHTSAIKLPLKDIEQVVNESYHVSVGPCPCRIIFGEDNQCDDPVFTCLKINHFSKFTTKLQKIAGKLNEEKGLELGNKNSKVLSKKEAIDLIRNARKRDLIISLESCIQPYQNNICLCCTDCCIELNLRYKFGLDVSPRGPYKPSFDINECSGCNDCISRCPVQAIKRSGEKKSFYADMEICLGCGICAENCPGDAISMEVDKTSLPSMKKPGRIKRIYIYLILITMYSLFRIHKRTTKNENFKYFQAQPKPNDMIQ